MSYKVVNTIYNPERDFGEKYLKALDVNLINGLWWD